MFERRRRVAPHRANEAAGEDDRIDREGEQRPGDRGRIAKPREAPGQGKRNARIALAGDRRVCAPADPGVLDIREGAIRARVKLAATECGGEFKGTAGPVLLDRRLTPQPNPGKVYQGSASGSGRPTSYGVQSVCVYLEDQGASRQFATDTTNFRVNVSRPCTSAAAKYDTAAGALARAQAQLRHAQGTATRTRLTKLVVRRGANASADKHQARSACGAGVPL